MMEAVQAVEAGRRNMYDPDEIEEEQRERELRNKVCLQQNPGTHLRAESQHLTPMSHVSALHVHPCLKSKLPVGTRAWSDMV